MGTPLSIAIRLLPTPRVQAHGAAAAPEPPGRHGPNLMTAVTVLLPTPDATHGRETTRTSTLLPGVARSLLPTPTAEGGTGYMSGSNRDTWRPTLESAVKGYLPVLHQGRPDLLKTPTAQLAVNGGSQHPDKRRAGGHGPTLADQVEHLLPTPTAMDSHGARNATSGRSSLKPSVNNDGWTLSDVFWTGESTRPPSGAGKPSPGDLLPRQLTLDEAEYPG